MGEGGGGGGGIGSAIYIIQCDFPGGEGLWGVVVGEVRVLLYYSTSVSA